VAIQATASSNVVRVEYLYHTHSAGLTTSGDPPVFIGGSSQAPFRVDWSLPRACDFTVSLVAIAFDACGNAGDSVVHVSICY
jgi:hypothetical protein